MNEAKSIYFPMWSLQKKNIRKQTKSGKHKIEKAKLKRNREREQKKKARRTLTKHKYCSTIQKKKKKG